uniref:Aldo keto reductase family 1, member B4 n=1 Tax=Echinococcus granulosus TaxID=6210 RepID=U6FR93_ECHGR|nr:aldo keto reductase family 1, member B4 [Echinococcus granulosus]
MVPNPSLLLNSGHKIPQLGFGTFDAPKEVVTEAVEVAISAGFRHIDCAMIYGNEKEYLDLYLIRFPASFKIKEGVSFNIDDPNSVVFEYHKIEDTWKEENVVEIARKHKKTPAQVLLRHGLQRGIVVLVKSVTPERIKSNFDVFNFELTNEEMEVLNKTGPYKRIFAISALEKHPEYPYHDEC